MHGFENSTPEKILKRSLKILDPRVIDNLKGFVRDSQTPSGGFMDRAGNPDLYYTLFGWFLADALEMQQISSSAWNYAGTEIARKVPDGVHLHCAAILSAKSGHKRFFRNTMGEKFRQNIRAKQQPVYDTFLSMLSCYYLRDLRGLFMISKRLEAFKGSTSLPCPVNSAVLMLHKSFGKPVDDLIKKLLSFYTSSGGFKAANNAPVPDLLSTAVALYALGFAGYDLRIIKPGSLDFVDSLFRDGGFAGNIIDQDPDIEYTFYGLLALGSLAD